jgi:hypothetical protein
MLQNDAETSQKQQQNRIRTDSKLDQRGRVKVGL